MAIEVDIEKKLGKFHLRTKFTAGNEVLALLGASGCGKSMTLKCIAGIEKPDRGRIVVDGVTLFDSEKRIDLTAQARRTGLMFQNYALFPNMTVLQNVQAGARREKDKKQREARVRTALERLELTELAGHLPHQLSGGQQQRTALARILVSEPKILLLDEPFSALDSHLRFQVERQVGEVIREFGKTVILVSHDRDEVYRLADRIAVMEDGRISTVGEKQAVFSAPMTRSAALLTGCKNISRVERLDGQYVRALDWGMTLRLTGETPEYVGIRMRDIRIGEGENALECEVVQVLENPGSYLIFLRPVGQNVAAPLIWETEAWQPVDRLTVHLPTLMRLQEDV